MTLNGIIAFVLPNSIALQAVYVTVIEDRPMMSAKYRLPLTFDQNWPTQQSHGLFATAKLLVHVVYSVVSEPRSYLPFCGYNRFYIKQLNNALAVLSCF